ncbi:serine/threonine-protein kinase [Ornithinimicrobium sp. LYQ103]|uniref:serine/threonine-protein kinase n=1 Tax=Ornithinimicrobium sp. LYQ103 TaxID=3378796 RepID=UPI003852B41B
MGSGARREAPAPAVPGYEVLGPLGVGASSTVWQARRRADGLVVALKVLDPAGGDVSAGLREAGRLAQVRHPHVLHLYDVLALPDPLTGRPATVALAVQLALGGSLAQVLGRRRILSAGEVVTVLQPVADALTTLHAGGLVHGDLSAGNILFRHDGMPVLADLGASLVTGVPGGDPQGTGASSGLVAPEVVEGFSPTRESDVYQVGAIAWWCLAGEPPGPAYARGDLDELAPGLPDGLTDLVRRALAPEPEDRPDAEELALGLMASAAPEPVEVAPDADPVDGLTERLRGRARWRAGRDVEAAGDDGGDGGDGGDDGGGGLGSTRRLSTPGSHRPGRVARVRAASQGEGGLDSVLSTALVVSAVVVAVLVAVLVWPGLQPFDREAAPAAERSQPVATGMATPTASAEAQANALPARSDEPGQVTSGSGSSAGTARSEEEAVADEASESTEPGPDDDRVRAALQRLVDGRGEAWESADEAELMGVMAEGSPALHAERGRLAELRSSGVRYPDVTFRVEDATVVGRTEDRLTVDATLTRAALSGVDEEGERRAGHPVGTERVRLVLAAGDDGWLLWSWAEPGGS